jgi:hypothetical protein
MVGLPALSLTTAVIISGDESAARGGPRSAASAPSFIQLRSLFGLPYYELGGVQMKTCPVCAQLI